MFTKSKVWDHFDKFSTENSSEQNAKCKWCSYVKIFSNTTKLVNHLRRDHPAKFRVLEHQLIKPKRRKCTGYFRGSIVWTLFKKYSDESTNQMRVKCNLCGFTEKYYQSTSNMIRHLQKIHPNEYHEQKIQSNDEGCVAKDTELPVNTTVAEPREPRPVKVGKIALKRKKILYYERLRMLQARRKLKAGNDTLATNNDIDPEQIIYNEPVKVEPEDQAPAPDSPKEPIKNGIEQKYPDNDEDLLFAMSLVPFLKRVHENSKIDARIEIFQVLRRFTTQQTVHSVNQYQTTTVQYPCAPPSFQHHQSNPMQQVAADPTFQDRTYRRIGTEMNVVISDESNPSDILELGSVKCE